MALSTNQALLAPGRVRMSREHRSASAGLTIIELLFVMAIAGVIMLLVFLALPALLRNGHNNDRKQDATMVLQTVASYELSNSGKFPDPCSGDVDPPVAPGDPQSCKSLFMQHRFMDLRHYEPSAVQAEALYAGYDATSLTMPGDDELFIHNYLRCEDNKPTGVAAGVFDAVALYRIETRTGFEPACQEL